VAQHIGALSTIPYSSFIYSELRHTVSDLHAHDLVLSYKLYY